MRNKTSLQGEKLRIPEENLEKSSIAQQVYARLKPLDPLASMQECHSHTD